MTSRESEGTAPTEADRRRVGDRIRARRKELGFTQADVQARGGPSSATLRLIEKGAGADYRRGTIEPLERVLMWTQGSIERDLYFGQTPVPMDPATARPIADKGNPFRFQTASVPGDLGTIQDWAISIARGVLAEIERDRAATIERLRYAIDRANDICMTEQLGTNSEADEELGWVVAESDQELTKLEALEDRRRQWDRINDLLVVGRVHEALSLDALTEQRIARRPPPDSGADLEVRLPDGRTWEFERSRFEPHALVWARRVANSADPERVYGDGIPMAARRGRKSQVDDPEPHAE